MTIYVADTSRASNVPFSYLYELLQPEDRLEISSGVRLSTTGLGSSVALLTSRTSIFLDEGAAALSRGTVFAGTGDFNSISVSNDAVISGGFYAIKLDGTHNSIGNSGAIRAGFNSPGQTQAAIYTGGQSTINNFGSIESNGTYAILLDGIGGNDINNGIIGLPSDTTPTISAKVTAIRIEGDTNRIVNTGTISSQQGPTLHFSGGEGGQNLIQNQGSILATPGRTAILSEGTANDAVLNFADAPAIAVIRGNIALGDGFDSVGNNGQISGSISMGADEDSVTNTGRIDGNVDLGSGHDFLDSTGGIIRGRIFGGSGNDVIFGSDGNDSIYGGADSDELFGGLGRDAFVFDTALGSGNVDAIGDFTVGEDRIYLSRSIFSAIHGSLSSAEFHIGTAAKDRTDQIIYDDTTGALYYDPNGNAAGGQVQFATLSAGLALTAKSFVIV